MSFSKLHFLTIVAMATLSVSSCMENTKESNPDFSEDGIEFNIEVSDPTDKGATLLITNNGSDRNTWFAFAYDDINTSPEAAINRKLKELSDMKEDLKEILQRGSRRIRIESALQSATKYTYVVFGLTSEGTIYGKPASCEFKTMHSETTYKLELVNETSASADIVINPKGSDTDTWFAFVSSDTSTPVDELIQTEIKDVTDIKEVLNLGKKTLTFDGLEASKKLRAIVTGLDSDGEVYGTPSVLEFRLTPDAIANDAWKVTYDGYVTPQGADKPYRKITNTSTDNERYFIDVISEANLQTTFNNDINKYVKYAVEKLKSTNANWSKYVFSQTGSMYYTLRTRKSYFALAIGIDRNGYFTGKFAISDKFYIEGKDWSDVYNKWLGKWEVVDNDGYGYHISIEEDNKTDYTFNITGWNGVIDTPIHGVIDDATGELCLSAYNYGKHNLVTADGTISVTKMLVGQAGKYFYGVSDDNSDSYYICSCSLSSDGTSGAMKGYTMKASTGSITFSMMFFIGVDGNTTYTYGDKAKFPIFPCKMGRAGNTKSTEVNEQPSSYWMTDLKSDSIFQSKIPASKDF